jgi:hypothetical protein
MKLQIRNFSAFVGNFIGGTWVKTAECCCSADGVCVPCTGRLDANADDTCVNVYTASCATPLDRELVIGIRRHKSKGCDSDSGGKFGGVKTDDASDSIVSYVFILSECHVRASLWLGIDPIIPVRKRVLNNG